MPDAAELQIGEDGGGGGGLVGWVKQNPLLAAGGAGALIALVVLIRRSGQKADTGSGSAVAPEGGQLSPSANIALGQIAYDVTQGFGQAGIAARDQAAATQSNFDRISEILAGLDTAVTGVGGQVAGVQSGLVDLSTLVQGGQNAQNIYQQIGMSQYAQLMAQLTNQPWAIPSQPASMVGTYHPNAPGNPWYTGPVATASPNSLAADPGLQPVGIAAA